MKHLCVLTATGAAELWSESDVLPGEDYELTVSRRLELSSFVVLLLSADYLYELYMRGAMQKLEERAQQATLIPVLTSPVDIRGTFVERISPLPADGRFITTWSNTEEAWFEVARALRDGLEACRAGAARILN